MEVPLGMAKKLILLSADKYDTSFSLTQYVSHSTDNTHVHVAILVSLCMLSTIALTLLHADEASMPT